MNSRAFSRITACFFVLLSFIPVSALGQAAIAGSVTGPSGEVLPGVIIEASSPALIEKISTSWTDERGRYRRENLRPGVYTVAFIRQDLPTYIREGIELVGSFTATVNAHITLNPQPIALLTPRFFKINVEFEL